MGVCVCAPLHLQQILRLERFQRNKRTPASLEYCRQTRVRLRTATGVRQNRETVAAGCCSVLKRSGQVWHIFVGTAVYVEGSILPLAVWFLTFINFATILLGCTP